MTREKGIIELLKIAIKNISEFNGVPFKANDQTTKVCEELGQALFKTYDSGIITPVSGTSTVLQHNKGYVPGFNIVTNSPNVHCSDLTDTTITISYTAPVSFRVYCY